MSNNFGIYIGNSTASIAIFKEDGKAEVLANQAGDRVTPAVVSISHQEKEVGLASISFSKASCTVTNNKKFLDTSLTPDELEVLISLSTVPVNTENGVVYTISEPDKKPLTFTPAQVAVLIFKKLYNIGVGACGQKNLSCVLCAPKNWNEVSRANMSQCAEEAGWNVLQVINEGPSALMAYRIGYDRPAAEENVLVYRLGGISCEATVIKVFGGFYSILTSVQSQTGGHEMIKVLTDHLIEEFSRKYYLDPTESRKSIYKFRQAAQGILHTLSTVPICSRFIESACEGVDFNASVSVARFNSLIAPLLPLFSAPIHKALEDTKLSSAQISRVILCGGGLKVPKIRSHVSSFFDCEALCSILPDEVFAFGAALQAGLVAPLEGKLDSTTKLPFLSPNLKMMFNNEEITLENVVLPVFKQMTLEPDDKLLTVSATQDNISGKTDMNVDMSSGVKVNVQVSQKGELLIEAIEKSGNNIKGFIDFQVD